MKSIAAENENNEAKHKYLYSNIWLKLMCMSQGSQLCETPAQEQF